MKGGKKNSRQAFFFFHENPKTMVEEALQAQRRVTTMASHPHHPSEVVPSFEKRKNKRERKRERQRERERVCCDVFISVLF